MSHLQAGVPGEDHNFDISRRQARKCRYFLGNCMTTFGLIQHPKLRYCCSLHAREPNSTRPNVAMLNTSPSYRQRSKKAFGEALTRSKRIYSLHLEVRACVCRPFPSLRVLLRPIAGSGPVVERFRTSVVVPGKPSQWYLHPCYASQITNLDPDVPGRRHDKLRTLWRRQL